MTQKQRLGIGLAVIGVLAVVAVVTYFWSAGQLKIGADTTTDLNAVPATVDVAVGETEMVTVENLYTLAEQSGTVCLWIPSSDWQTKFELVEPSVAIGSNQVSMYLERSTDDPNDINLYIKGNAEGVGSIYVSSSAGCSTCETSGLCTASTGNPIKIVVNVTATPVTSEQLTLVPSTLEVAAGSSETVTVKNLAKLSQANNNGNYCLWVPEEDYGTKFNFIDTDGNIATVATGIATVVGDDVQFTIQGIEAGTTGAVYFGSEAGCSACGDNTSCNVTTGDPVRLVVTVTEADDNITACSTNEFQFKYTPNAWNIMTLPRSVADIYNVFDFLGSERPVAAYTYPGTGQAYEENGSLQAGEGFWFNSGATSPACIPSSNFSSTAGQYTAPITSSIAMVGNPTSNTVSWSDITITIDGQTMSVLDASNQSVPLVKAVFSYEPGADDYTAFYADSYTDYISDGGNSMSTLMTQSLAPLNGVWIILNSNVTSATLNFPQ